MSRARRKGNTLERLVAAAMHDLDGHDPRFMDAETETGRLGHAYHLQTDVVTKHLAIECKNRESIGAYLWQWLNNIGIEGKYRALVVKRNRRHPLIIMDLDDFYLFVQDKMEEARERQ